jgi:pilus assembly protein CpaC
VQGGSNIGAVTIQFREFGVRINFLPTITPRGTIRLQVAPEVSSLDYSNAIVLQGFTVPAISTRRVQTEVELESGQSFAVAGLLDNRVTETFNKIPGIGDIPILGKLFQSRLLSKNNTELLVMVTPELVRPMVAGATQPSLPMPVPFMKEPLKEAPRTPGMDITGPVPVKPQHETIPLEQMLQMQRQEQGTNPGNTPPPVQFVPVPMIPAPNTSPNPGLTPLPGAASGGSGGTASGASGGSSN